MLYISTRGQGDMQPSAHVIKEGLAKDGGLFVPQRFPGIHVDDILALHSRSYQDCATKILGYFLTDYSAQELAACTAAAYAAAKFGPEPAPLVKINEKIDTLELWHGPTSAFKDMALQLLPQLLSRALLKTGEDTKSVILVATSGDTGKAALEGFADVPNTEIIVFYPSQGVSPMQKKQMTTQTGANVHVFGIEGNFDDAQTAVKKMFNDKELAAELSQAGFQFSSANSINIGRLVPQIVYYVYAYAALVRQNKIEAGQEINIVVPTGNFGNILAAFYAKQMGLPVNKLICASNENKVLFDFFSTGTYNRKRDFILTSSPSMDILISSNLERLIYRITGGNPEECAKLMENLSKGGEYTITPEMKAQLKDFYGNYCSEEETKEAIREVYKTSDYVIDTHTAVAAGVYKKYVKDTGDKIPAVIASTASPYKFTRSVMDAISEGHENLDDFGLADALEKLSGVAVPKAVNDIRTAPVLHDRVVDAEDMPATVKEILKIR